MFPFIILGYWPPAARIIFFKHHFHHVTSTQGPLGKSTLVPTMFNPNSSASHPQRSSPTDPCFYCTSKQAVSSPFKQIDLLFFAYFFPPRNHFKILLPTLFQFCMFFLFPKLDTLTSTLISCLLKISFEIGFPQEVFPD